MGWLRSAPEWLCDYQGEIADNFPISISLVEHRKGKLWKSLQFASHLDLLVFIPRKLLMNCIPKYDCRSCLMLCVASFPKPRKIFFFSSLEFTVSIFFPFPSFLRGLHLNSVTERVWMKLPSFSYFNFKYAWCAFLAWFQLQILTPNCLSFFHL